jgi:adenylosuccinate synthase
LDRSPETAQKYLARIEELTGVAIRYVSVGAEREAMFEVTA